LTALAYDDRLSMWRTATRASDRNDLSTKGADMRHFRRWGAVYVLLLLFVGSWLGQFFFQLSEFRSDQAAHGQPFVWSEYWSAFFASTLENWQSEWLQLVFQAMLLLGAKHWLFKADAEDMERLEAKIDDIKDHLGLPTPPPQGYSQSRRLNTQ
jgi:hypothetical protein